MDPLTQTGLGIGTESAPAVPNVVIGALLGRGAFGAVYRGRHSALDLDVAVKLVSADGADAATLERALLEARLMARLDHPNLLRIHDAGRLGAALYMVIEYMDGGSLASLRGATGERLLDVARQLASALQALHEARVLHRDIKPANCLARSDGRVKLADLGIAIEVRTRAEARFAGTLPFMAPELLQHPPRFGARSDLYALGLTLACMALDADPFPTGSFSEVVSWISTGPRPALARARPDLPSPLLLAIDRMLAVRPEDRPADAGAVLALLGSGGPANAVAVAVAGAVAGAGAVADPGAGAAAGATPRVPVAAAGTRTIGPWVLGDVVYETSNWQGVAVTHLRTGAPGRLSRLRAGSWLHRAADVILASADRAAALDHPALLAILDWGLQDQRPYIVTAPQGRTLRELVASGGPLDELEALRLVTDLADALSYIHALGLVYQLVEPGSALITRDGRGAQLGWPMYCVPVQTAATGDDGKPRRMFVPQHAAPEALGRKGTVEIASDLWGLGEVLHFLLAGRPAFEGTTGPASAMARTAPPPPLHEVAPLVTRPTAQLVARLLSIDPADRPADAAAVRDTLRRISGRLAGGAPGERRI